jgi:hypothetical protein
VARSRAPALVVVPLLLVALGVRAGEATPLERGPAGTLVAAPGDRDAYPHLIGQEHVGGRCTPDDIEVAGGTIVGAGGQVVAGGGGTGVGCDTFYAYELRSGEPKTSKPFLEPGIYVDSGSARPQSS